MSAVVILSTVVALVALAYIRTPSVLAPVIWEKPNKLPSFEGPTAVNSVLKNGVKVTGNFAGPESIAFDSINGNAYASFNDGTIGYFSPTGEFLGRVFFVGGFLMTIESHGTNGLVKEAESLMNWCNEEALAGRLAWNEENEYKCGRPLGLRFRVINDERFLFFVDSRHGLFRFNLDANLGEHLMDETLPVSVPTAYPYDNVITLPIRFFNDMDINEDNTMIVFSDSSYKHTRTANRQEVLDGAPRGRLFQFDLTTGQLTVALCGLHFPNGVQLRQTAAKGGNLGDLEVIVAELTRFRLVKINLSYSSVQDGAYTQSCDENSGSLAEALGAALNPNSVPAVTVFTDSLPGIPDNVRMDTVHADKNGKAYYMIGFGSNSVWPVSPLWLGYQLYIVREFVGKFVPMQMVEKLVPRYGLAVVVNHDGAIVNTVQDPSGTNAMVSEVDIHPMTGDMWVGSHSEGCVVIVRKEHLPANWE